MKPIKSRTSRVTRIVCLLLALHFFNFSIDSRDANSDAIPEDLTVNDIESVTEFLTEVVLNIHNAFAEHDEKDGEGGGALDFSKEFCCANLTRFSFKSLISPVTSPKGPVTDTRSILSLSRDVMSPPPKA
jgi:hypothetical protein